MPKTWTERLVVSAAALLLAACATTKDELLPHDSHTTMLDIWNMQTSGGAGSPVARQLLDARQSLRRPLSEEGEQQLGLQGYTRTAQNEIYHQFSRLPNPDLVMFVFPHLAGSEQVPVPGYSTAFPLHQRVQYALPGERIEDY